MSKATDGRPPISPRHWPSWLAVGIMWLLGKLPPRIGFCLSVPLGGLLYRLATRRVEIARRNIQRCFPELGGEEQENLLKAHIQSLARMLFEICWTWSASERVIRKILFFKGDEHLRAAQSQGRGILLITHHVTCLEIGGRVAGFLAPEAMGVYRPLKNPVIEWYQNRSRKRYVQGSIRKRDPRAIIRFLRDGGVLWYAPDQDFGPKRSEFAPFFDIETATLKATTQFVAMSGCAVVPMFPAFDPETRTYTVTFKAPMEDFPSGDMRADLTRINSMFEEEVRQAPEQYWWIHRRFKTRPPGEPPFYD